MANDDAHDDDDSDDEEQQQRQQPRRNGRRDQSDRGQQGQGRIQQSPNEPKGKPKDKPKQDPDISKDPKLIGFVREGFEDVFNDVAEALGDTALVQKIFDVAKAHDKSGIFGSYVIAPFLEQRVEDGSMFSKFLKDLPLVGSIIPPILTSNVDKAMGGFIGGLRRKYRESGQLTKRDVYDVKKMVREDLKKVLAESCTYPQALQALTADEQKAFYGRIAALDEDRRTSFDKIKSKISSPKDVRVLFALPDSHWIPHLEQRYGAPTAPVASGIANLLKEASGVVKSVFAPPSGEHDRILNEINKATRRMKRRTST